MAQKKSDCDYMVKLLIIGDSGVGKTCLLMRFCESSFTNNHLTTIGIDFKLKSMDIDGKKIKMQIWDTAGQERFKTITQTYYKGAQGIILVYGVDDRISFQKYEWLLCSIENWMKQINIHAQEKVCKILVGNKSDTNDRVIQTHEGQKLADSYRIPFYETSAKAGVNIYELFNSTAKLVVDSQYLSKSSEPQSSVMLNQQQAQQNKKEGGCC